MTKAQINNKYVLGNKIEILFDFINKGVHYQLDDQQIFILGNPIIDGKINFEKIRKKIIHDNFNQDFIKKIDGEFLIIIYRSDFNLLIVNDRFSSIPLYYSIVKNKFIISPNFLTLFKKIDKKSLNHEKFMEFLYFQRLHGENTYESSIKSMNSASIIEYNFKKVVSKKYWFQDYKKDHSLSIYDYAKKLSELIFESINSKLSDFNHRNNFGLFLSGGMDSRTVLGSFKKFRPIAFTLGFSKLGEYRVSRKISKIISNEHDFIKLQKEYFSKNFKRLIHISSGLYRFDHGIFCGIKNQISDKVKVVFNSTALDYWFQGYYIPKTNIKIFGKPTYYNNIRKQNGFFEDDYFYNIPYRFKKNNPLDYIKSNKSSFITSYIKNEVKKIYELGINNGCYNFYDCWDYILNDNISRHFSYFNNLSMHDSCEPRTIAFYNRIFDLFLKIPIEYRFNAKVSKETLKIVNYKFSKVISANHGMKITGSPFEMTMHTIFRKIASQFSSSKQFRHPVASDRTWPDPYSYLKGNKFLFKKAEDLKKSEYLDMAMPYLDRDKLNKDIDSWLFNSIDGGDILYRLITINEFLKQGYK